MATVTVATDIDILNHSDPAWRPAADLASDPNDEVGRSEVPDSRRSRPIGVAFPDADLGWRQHSDGPALACGRALSWRNGVRCRVRERDELVGVLPVSLSPPCAARLRITVEPSIASAVVGEIKDCSIACLATVPGVCSTRSSIARGVRSRPDDLFRLM